VSKKEPGSGAKPRPDLHPEFVALGFLAEGPAHGYELYRRFTASLGSLWHISESQFYATLKRSEAHGFIVASTLEKGEGGAKRLLSLSPEGRRLLLVWINEPTRGSARLVHMEFLARLFLARIIAPLKLRSIIIKQTAALDKEIRRLRLVSEGSHAGGTIDGLSADFRESQLRAAVAWIESKIIPTVESGQWPGPYDKSKTARRHT